MATDSLGSASGARRAKGVRWAVSAAVVICVLRFMPWTSQWFLFPLVENFAYDQYFDARPPQPIDDYVIIAIDDPSLQKLGRFPWTRARYAELLPQLASAKVVAFDLLFAEPEAADAQLAAALRRHGRVVLAAHKRRTAANNSDRAPDWQGYGQLPYGDLPSSSASEEYVGPVPTLQKAAAGIGYADIYPDADGVYRRFQPLEVGIGGYVYPHFSTEIARVAGSQARETLVATGSLGALEIGQQRRVIPLRQGSALINYAGPMGTVRTLSFAEVLAGKYRDRPETFKDKIVLVGATAAGLYDVRPAPFRSTGRVFYGVETNANIAHTLLEAMPLRDARGSWVWALYAIVVGSFVGWAIWHSREVLATVIGVGVLALLALPTFWVAISFMHQVVPYGAIVWAVAIPMGMALYERLGVDKRQVQAQFGTYVSPDVLRELTHHPDLVRQGQRRTVTLLFSDVRGSTTLCEQIPPDVWIAQLNEYLSEMSDAVFAYDGYLDKFMGDGVMALWNAFGNQEDHAELALKAAVQMLARLERLNAQWAEREDRVPLQIGIGLHTGEAAIGNVGSWRRAQYTAIGDTVNTASRIEALTKEFGAQLLLSETTAEIVGGKAPLIELGSAELKGREQAIRVFKPEGYAGEVRGHVQQKTK